MKPAFTEAEGLQIRRGKQFLRHLWKQSGLKMKDILLALEAEGNPVKKTTLSMWLSNKADNWVRPKQELLAPLVKLLLTDASQQEQNQSYDELALLFLYTKGPEHPELMRNRLAQELDGNLGESLQQNQQQLSVHLQGLELLLERIEPEIMDYGKSHPLIRLESRNLKLLRQLLGKDPRAHQAYLQSDGTYEIPLTKIQSLDAVSEVLNHLNQGSRLMRAFVERHLLAQGDIGDQFYRIEDFVAYCWEISDRLLQHNFLCQSVPLLKASLLRVMATCWGIRYLLTNQTGHSTAIEFQNILQRKGKISEADIQCSVAVYMGLLARQLLRQGSPERIQKGLQLYKQALQMLSQSHPQLSSEQEVFFYKKELANLQYDLAALLLWHQSLSSTYPALIQESMQGAAQGFTEVLETVNLFYEGLTEVRAQHIRAFYLLSLCWTQKKLSRGVAEINKFASGQALDQQFWFVEIVKTTAYGILAYRCQNPYEQADYQKAARHHLERAQLVSGMAEQTRQELAQDYILSQAFEEYR